MIVNAKISGDGECFCFSVDTETYIKLFGREKYDEEVAFQKESCNEIGMKHEERTVWNIYPNQLLNMIGKKNEVKIEIITDSRLINRITIT